MNSKRNEFKVKNHTIFTGDNLDVLLGFNDEVIDLIYLDPPFNSKRNYAHPVGKNKEVAGFEDTWTPSKINQMWRKALKQIRPDLNEVVEIAGKCADESMECYMVMMAVRLIQMHRVLKPTGSLYLHCDPTASHYLKLALDMLFGHDNFRNEVIWWYGGGGASKRQWGRKHDVLLYYSKDKNNWTFNTDAVREPHKWDKGQLRADGSPRDLEKGKLPDDVFKMHGIMPWAKEHTGYPTQKPLALLERIIRASSNPKDLILDPFCGCATTMVAAERLGRRWIGIDSSPKAYDLLEERLIEEYNLPMLPFKPIQRTDLPKRTDTDHLPAPSTHKGKLFGESKGKCQGEGRIEGRMCDTPFEYEDLEVDHIIPSGIGGTDHYENLQLLCHKCHKDKTRKEAMWRTRPQKKV